MHVTQLTTELDQHLTVNIRPKLTTDLRQKLNESTTDRRYIW